MIDGSTGPQGAVAPLAIVLLTLGQQAAAMPVRVRAKQPGVGLSPRCCARTHRNTGVWDWGILYHFNFKRP